MSVRGSTSSKVLGYHNFVGGLKVEVGPRDLWALSVDKWPSSKAETRRRRPTQQ